MTELNLKIDGMGCGRCVARVQTALGAVPGLNVQRVEVGSARVSYDPARTSPQAIATALSQNGYTLQAAETAAK